MRVADLLVLHVVAASGASWFTGPAPGNRTAWIAGLRSERVAALKTIKYDGGVFDNEALRWTQTNYIQPQVHPWDSYFYDRTTHQYTVGRYLDDLERRYGGIDSVLVWPTFPQLGLDDRNQFDLIRLMPGGLDGVRRMTDDFHARGVKVLWPYNPWDVGTRREGRLDSDIMAELMREIGGDGVNGDTMSHFDPEWWNASVREGRPLALQPEGEGTDPFLNTATLGWAEGMPSPAMPVVDRFKWLESRWTSNVCDRWDEHKGRGALLAGYFNGFGLETWESVWGCWNGITERDGEAIRRAATILRYFGKLRFLQSPDWEPHVLTLVPGVYASMFPSLSGGETVWLVVNKAKKEVSGNIMTVDLPAGSHLYDCYHGTSLETIDFSKAARGLTSVAVNVSFSLEVDGVGCVIATPNSSTVGAFASFLSSMRNATVTSLDQFNDTVIMLHKEVIPIVATKVQQAPPSGMVAINATGEYQFVAVGTEFFWHPNQQGGKCGTQYPWESMPSVKHNHNLSIPRFHMDRFPVTCGEYSSYLNASGYVPRDPTRWLFTWNGSRSAPANLTKKPVTHVTLDEARAYCKWAGKRLPRSWEWQYAAQGLDARKYPWGSTWGTAGVNAPASVMANTYPGPMDVDAHPSGCSPFGVCDMVANVWQYTDEVRDIPTGGLPARSNFAILKGGSAYIPNQPHVLWYKMWNSRGHDVTEYSRTALLDESYDRSATVGFRCAVDAESPSVLAAQRVQMYV